MVLSPDRPYTIESAIRVAAEQFEQCGLCFGHGTATAFDEASWLVLHAIGNSPIDAPDYSQVLRTGQISACNELLTRRISERMPAAYLTGRAWFAGHEFVSDQRALVPRSPLAEFIVENFYGLLDGIHQPAVLDLCTGSGCIAIACAHALPDSVVHASDLSPQALALARENICLHDMKQRIGLFEGSLFEPITERYDLIISNPPYVDAKDMDAMPAEFSHEPAMGLAAGDDGLDLVHIMLQQAADHLSENGYLIVEVGNSWQALLDAYPLLDFNWLEFDQGGDGVFMLEREQLKTLQ